MLNHHRRSIRLSEFDYSTPGAYFATLVTADRENLFGEIAGETMNLNPTGCLVENEWKRLPSRFSGIRVDDFVVMPNHVHGIIVIEEANRVGVSAVGARQKEDLKTGNPILASPLPSAIASPLRDNTSPLQDLPTVGVIIGSFNSTTARLINGFRRSSGAPVWQRNYYEHVVRNSEEWQRIHDYIQANPLNWQTDDENPEKVK